MFPYPSGAGFTWDILGILHLMYARDKRHQGFNVLHPMVMTVLIAG
jgi:leucyl-tRNA synthetase